MAEPDKQQSRDKPIRWWPAGIILVVAVAAIVWVRFQSEWAFQRRNMVVSEIVIVVGMLLLVWWTFLSRAPKRLRLGVTFGLVGLAVVGASLFRIRGMSGDLLPIVEFRWGQRSLPPASVTPPTNAAPVATVIAEGAELSFPQYYGPNRDGVLRDVHLDTNWTAHPPQVVWRHAVGAGWSGFVIAGQFAITQEQRAGEECVVAYDLLSGREVWRHSDPVRYDSTIAGEGPRATPTVAGKRVFTAGSTGILNCLELATGQRHWTRDLIKESGGKVPQWGYTCAPLLAGDLVLAHGGEGADHSIYAFQQETGAPAWAAGIRDASYAALTLRELAGVTQVLAFNNGSVSGHNPTNGATLWEKSWGNGNVVCSVPVVVSSNRVLFSSGYGYGAELLEISRTDAGRLTARLVWKSIRMKAKFAHLWADGGALYGLDDGILACVNLEDGSQRWKEGRYGHGQGLVVGEHYLLMAESGELILLRPTPEAPHELARLAIFTSKTWNPPALAGEYLLVRNDQEAVCLRVKFQKSKAE